MKPTTADPAFIHSRRLILSLTCLCATLVAVLLLPLSGEERVYDDAVQMRVIAASDREEDQALKLRVRDALLPLVERACAGAETPAAVRERLSSELPLLRQTAREVLRREGSTEEVTVDFGPHTIDRRTFGGAVYPAGDYPTLFVVIGAGQGHNWWTVLYPELSLYVASDAPASSLGRAGELYQQRDVVETRLRVLEWLEALFEAGDGQ